MNEMNNTILDTHSIDYWRQLDLIDPKEVQNIRICIVGSGSVGSFTALTLSKMGIRNITVYDDDIVSNHNIPNQFFPIASIGQAKVETLAVLIKQFSGINIKAVNKKFDNNTEIDGQPDIFITATDTMKSRKQCWEKVKEAYVRYFIDARMGGEVFKIYTVPMNSITMRNRYESTLHNDAESSEERCTAHSIIYNVLTISSFISNIVKKLTKKENYPNETVMCLLTNFYLSKQWK